MGGIVGQKDEGRKTKDEVRSETILLGKIGEVGSWNPEVGDQRSEGAENRPAREREAEGGAVHEAAAVKRGSALQARATGV